jgi:hypothetical protein
VYVQRINSRVVDRQFPALGAAPEKAIIPSFTLVRGIT